MTARHCLQCGRPIMLVDPTPWVISLNRAWVHVRVGIVRGVRADKRVDHAPVVSR